MSEPTETPEITDINPYETLGVSSKSTPAEIRTAYRKRALATHPDKAKPEDREKAHQSFQNLALAYAVLSDEKRRNRYDRTGSTAESALGDEDFDWGSFFREQFQEINVEAVEKFKKEYQGSAEERADLLKAYVDHEGALDAIFEEIMVSNPIDDETRFSRIIDDAIESGEVQAYRAYTKESKASKKRRLAKAQGEAMEAEAYARELGVHKDLFQPDGKPKSSKTRKLKNPDKSSDDMSGLEALIRSRNSSRMEDLVQNLETKYGTKKRKGKALEEPDEEAFAKARKRLSKKR